MCVVYPSKAKKVTGTGGEGCLAENNGSRILETVRCALE